MNGPIMATTPSRTGSEVRAAEWAMAAEPRPASLENAPRVTPVTRIAIRPPQPAALSVNASVKIDLSSGNTSEILAQTITRQTAQ